VRFLGAVFNGLRVPRCVAEVSTPRGSYPAHVGLAVALPRALESRPTERLVAASPTVAASHQELRLSESCRARSATASRVVRAALPRVVSSAQRYRESCRARSSRRELAFRERVVSCVQRNRESCRAHSATASRVVRAAQDAVSPSESESCRARSAGRELAFRERVVSCAQLTTRLAPCTASTSQVGSPNPARSVRAKLARTAPSRSSRSTEGHRSRLASCAPLTTRGGRTHARSSQGPYARGSCHARELVTRAATFQRESGVNPSGNRRPPTEGRTGRVPRNPVDEETTRSRVRLRALHRVSQGRVPFGAHASKKPKQPPDRSARSRPNGEAPSRSSTETALPRTQVMRAQRANCPRSPNTSKIVSAASSNRT
jgi:hypothetical protein